MLALPGLVGAQSIPVTLGGPASSLVGVEFQIPVEVDMSARTERLGSFAIRLQWNPAVLQLVKGANGNFGQVTVNQDSLASGVLRMTGANPLGLTGKVTLGIGFATPLTADTTTIRLRVDELYAAQSYTDLTASVLAANRAYCPARGRFGDLEPDGTITSRDALLALMAAVGLALPAGTDKTVGDVDGDGVTDTRDALIILSQVVGLDVSAFRVGRIAPGSCGTDKLLALALRPGNVSSLVAGQKVQYSVYATDSAQAVAVTSGLTWSTTNAAVATVSALGEVTAVAAGQAVVSAREPGGRQGSATVSVVAARHTHVVDAKAFSATNQLGVGELPFSRIPDAVAFAAAGDTVLVRGGRYEGRIAITKSLVLLGADTGVARPVIAGLFKPPADSGGVVINGAGARVELRRLRFDTLYQAVTIHNADTVVISDADVRTASAAYASVYVDSVKALVVRRSRFDGAPSALYSTNAIYVYWWARALSLDSVLITDYGSDGIDAYGVDSLAIRNSAFRYNRGYGVYAGNDSVHAMKAVISRTAWVQNNYGHIELNGYGSAKFDHNYMKGSGYDGIQLYGFTTSVASLLGDSLDLAGSYYWLYTNRFDSLAIDSLAVLAGYYADLNGGRIVTVRNSQFYGVNYYALELYPYPRTSGQLILRNTAFRGVRECDRCADGVYSYNTAIDADGVTADNLSYVFDKSYLDLKLTNSTFTHVYQGVYSDCGSVRADQVTMSDVSYGFEAYGCSPDSLIVTNSTITGGAYQAIYAYGVAAVVRNTTISRSEYGVYAFSGSLVAEDNQITDPIYSYYGIYADANGLGSFIVRRNTITCNPGLNQWGVTLYDAPMTVDSNTISGCQAGIYLGVGTGTAGTPVGVRGNTVNLPGTATYGIVSAGQYEAVRVVKNTVTGPSQYGSIVVGYGSTIPKAEVDSNTVSASYNSGIHAYRVDTLRIRDNTVSNHAGGVCCPGYGSGAIVLDYANSTNAQASVLRNRVSLSKSNGIVIARYYGVSDTVTVLVDSNTVKGADSVGVWVRYYSKALLRKNAIDSSGIDAVRVSDNYRPESSTMAYRNNFTRSKKYGLRYLVYSTPYVVAADTNYWNSTDGPRCASGCTSTTGDSVSANVTFANFLGAAEATLVPAPPAYLSITPMAAPSAATGTALTPRSGERTPGVSRATPARPQVTRLERLPRFTDPGIPASGRVAAADRDRAAGQAGLDAARVERDSARQAGRGERDARRRALIEQLRARQQARDSTARGGPRP